MSGHQLSTDYIHKVARLSRLALSEAEVADMQAKLSTVVTYVDRLRKLELTDVEPLTNVADTTNRLDDDTPRQTLPNQVLMDLAPATLPPFVKIPKVLGDGGGA